jgi:hypothetical protein
MPADLVALREERVLLVEETDEPLARGHELERAVALLVELDGVFDGLGVVPERGAACRVLQQLDDRGARAVDGLPGERGVGAVGRLGIEALPARRAEGHGHEAAVAPEDLAERELLLAPPLHVGRVAEGADHEDARPLLGIDELAREDRHRGAEERRDGPLAEERPVASVVRMRSHPDARGQQLRPRRGDDELAAALDAERDVVERAARRAVFDLRLRDGGLEVDVPHRRRLDAVDVPLREEVEEARLRKVTAAVVDGRVLLLPVHREADAPPERLERLLVLARDPEAELDEVRPRHDARRLLLLRSVRRLEPEVRIVRRARVATDVEVVLHAALGREAVVVPPHGIEDAPAAHALVARDDVGLRVAEHVAHVERAGDGWRRRVDDEGLFAGARIPGMHAEPLPLRRPTGFGRGGIEMLRQRCGVDGTDIGHADGSNSRGGTEGKREMRGTRMPATE